MHESEGYQRQQRGRSGGHRGVVTGYRFRRASALMPIVLCALLVMLLTPPIWLVLLDHSRAMEARQPSVARAVKSNIVVVVPVPSTTNSTMMLSEVLAWISSAAMKIHKSIEVVYTGCVYFQEHRRWDGLDVKSKVVCDDSSYDILVNRATSLAEGRFVLYLPPLHEFMLPATHQGGILSPRWFEYINSTIYEHPDVGVIGTLVGTSSEIIHNAGIGYSQKCGTAFTNYLPGASVDSYGNPQVYWKYTGAKLFLSRWLLLILFRLGRNLYENNVVGVSKYGALVSMKALKEIHGFPALCKGFPITSDLEFSMAIRDHNYEIVLSPYKMFTRNPVGDWNVPGIWIKHPDFWYNTLTAKKMTDHPLRGQAEQEEHDVMQRWSPKLHKMISASQLLPDVALIWDLYCSCTGLNIEAINFLVPLEPYLTVSAIAGKDCFCKGFPDYYEEALKRISARVKYQSNKTLVFVSHKPPKSFPRFPYRGSIDIPIRPSFVIGRCMSEYTPIPKLWVQNSDLVDELWVPSFWHKEVFSNSGIASSKIFVIPEPLDIYLYDPDSTLPLQLPLVPRKFEDPPFRFLSVFKFEWRKGWDVLLRAYYSTFSKEDNVVLYLHTYLYGSSQSRSPQAVWEKIDEFLLEEGLLVAKETLPPVIVMTNELQESDMPSLYKAADAFVLPTRGEGWGLPIMEAMAMGLPTIATNFSGCTMLVDSEVAYPLDVESLQLATDTGYTDDPLRWAEPSVDHLSYLMRHIFAHPQEAKARGALARHKIVTHYSQERVAALVLDRLTTLTSKR